ncbi:MAG: lysine--tRNA ligase [Gammaproteobacteria bacterium]|nr:lysine--tRNA ligase [Gammaproteobacteria bacterium]
MSTEQQLTENEQIVIRRQKLAELHQAGQAYPNTFRRTHLAQQIIDGYDNFGREQLEKEPVTVILAGRIMTRRIMGKASFAHIQDMSGKIQIYIAGEELAAGEYDAFKTWDIGDIIGVQGTLFRTKTDELTVRATHVELVAKSLRPLPDKWHGLSDQELRYRRRYLDLMVNEESRHVFQKRSKLITELRNFLNNEQFMEVETPMMQVLAGGAAAKPFVTHHNALDMDMYLRIAPELYLKRLVVGGFERVYEINRNFRNEGVSQRHNPEFTMVEWYQAYAAVGDGMALTEKLFRYLAQQVLGHTTINYQGEEIDLAKPFKWLSVVNSIVEFNPDITLKQLSDLKTATAVANKLGIEIHSSCGLGKVQIEIFEKTVEHRLMQPTFITEYPAEVSPLARKNDNNPFIVDRFELFVGGREIANGFSELNDPDDQAERFKQQVEAKAHGDQEAMPYDEDYILALEYGLPPTCGVGIGIDRLAMLLTDTSTIRDVILFPHMRNK